MNNDGLIFYKKISPYAGDYTKNSALSGEDVDNNFFNLKSQDINTMAWDEVNKTLSLTKKNGDVLSVNDIIKDSTYSFCYDAENGVLKINIDGADYSVPGFTTKEDLVDLSVDSTLSGDGTPDNPLKLADAYKTGLYRPVKKLVNIVNGESLPNDGSMVKGDRYLTLESISPYGLLYNYNGVLNIKNELLCQGSEWRIPSKEDWDNMLNAIEPNPEYKNHSNSSSNRALGQFAGKYLKSVNEWLLEGSAPSPCPTPPTPCDCACNSFITSSGCEPVNPTPNRGVDKYGFTVLPSGYGDGGVAMDYFKMRTVFWTTTQVNTSDIYVKRFDYDKSTVYQELVGPYNQFSVRLVKNYDGQNYNERETINGQNYDTIILPSANGQSMVWLKTNVNFNESKYCGVKPNNGIGVDSINKYFINEWNGCDWVKVEMVEGDMFVMVDGFDGTTNKTWRVVNSDVGFEIINTFEQIVNEIEIVYDNRIENLESALINEINRAMAAEGRIEGRFIDYTTTSDLTQLLSEYSTTTDIESNYYNKTEIDDKLSHIGGTVVNSVASSTPSILIGGTPNDVTIGLVIDESSTKGNVDITQDGNGLKANANIDLTGYVTESDLSNTLDGYYTKPEVDGITADKISDVSSLTNALIVNKIGSQVNVDFNIDNTGNVELNVTDSGLKATIDDSAYVSGTTFDAKVLELNTRITVLDSDIKAETARASDVEEVLRLSIEGIGNYGEY